VKLEKIGHLVTTDLFVQLKKISMETFRFSREVYGEDGRFTLQSISQDDLRGASMAGRLIMQRYVASDGNTFEGVGV